MIVRMLHQWETWWTRNSYPHVMGIVRIAMGGWLLLYWGIRLPHVPLLYSSDGIVLPVLPVFLPEKLVWLFNVPSPTIAFCIFTVHLIALLCVMVGYRTRTAAVIACILSWYYFYLSHHLFHTSYDRLYNMSLLFLALSRAGEIWSIEAWQKYGSPFLWKKMISIFPQRLFALQITATYFGVGFQKLWLPDWQGGEMLWYSMMGVWGTPLAFHITSYGWSPLYHVAVNLVKIFEILLPFSFWIRRGKIRWIGMASGLLFHILVDMLLYIWWFAILIPAYIVFFDPEEVYKWLQRAHTWAHSRVIRAMPFSLFQRRSLLRFRPMGQRGDTE